MPTQYLVAVDADENDVFAHHSVGVDSDAGLYVIDGQGRELNFSHEVAERVHEALGHYLAEESAVTLSTATN